MRGKRALSTRRRRALGWGILLCAVLLVNYFWGLYCVTPGHALRQMAARYGLPATEVWTAVNLPGVLDDAGEADEHYTLSYNDSCLLLSAVRFDLRKGWTAEPAALRQEHGEPVTLGQVSFCREIETGYETVYLFFGRVNAPDAAAVELAVRHSSLGEDEQGARWEEFPWQRARIPAGDFQTVGGYRQFVAVLDPVYDPGGSTYETYDLRLVREDGSAENIPPESTYGFQRY